VEALAFAFPQLNVARASFEIDHEYCIDVEVRKGEQVLLGIQLKPESYQRMSAPSQMQSKQATTSKTNSMRSTYAPYLYVYYNGTDGDQADIWRS
jgi:predicted phosphoadenosine phosphosulfate sulfurtransferase